VRMPYCLITPRHEHQPHAKDLLLYGQSRRL
jgi:hypothetical protein